jgi:hypothetical protein
MWTENVSSSSLTMQEHLEEGEKWRELLTTQSLTARVSKARRLLLAFVLFSIPLLSAPLPDWIIDLAVSTEITLQTNFISMVYEKAVPPPCWIRP